MQKTIVSLVLLICLFVLPIYCESVDLKDLVATKLEQDETIDDERRNVEDDCFRLFCQYQFCEIVNPKVCTPFRPFELRLTRNLHCDSLRAMVKCRNQAKERYEDQVPPGYSLYAEVRCCFFFYYLFINN